ncbi:MAG: carboxylating nicotinate-nucleotide diphosphorylase [Dehalococcoidia bacterium]|nr:carboxylating nicotinate-nucleotide diphosphorylase [Dehalococcoidia bacterium]
MLPRAGVDLIIDAALEEDVSLGDITTDGLVPRELTGRASFVVKAHGVLAGMEVALRVFQRVDPALQGRVLVADGSPVAPGVVVGEAMGPVAAILRAERTALNLLTRMSGIATETARYVQAVEGFTCQILDTRKTVPGLRLLDKYAVRMGGGRNHRYHLGDGVLVKDNHWEALKRAGITLAQGLEGLRGRVHHLIRIQVEVKDMAELSEAIGAGADVLLLDNMSPEEMAVAVKKVGGRLPLEASGGISLKTVRRVAQSGVDFISIGALTHSPGALDISLELEYQA